MTDNTHNRERQTSSAGPRDTPPPEAAEPADVESAAVASGAERADDPQAHDHDPSNHPAGIDPVSAQPTTAQPVSAHATRTQPVSAQPTDAEPVSAGPVSGVSGGARVAQLPASTSVLDAAEAAFAVLVSGPAPLALDAATIRAAGLGQRAMRMDRVRDLLLEPGVGYESRDRIWTAVVALVRGADPAWTIAAVGLCLPGLRRVAARLARTVPAGQVADLESELLAGFLHQLRVVDASAGRVPARLYWAAYRAGDAYRHSVPARTDVVVPLTESAAPPKPWGHPDFVLTRAVTDGVLSGYEAELIGTTRLEDVTLDQLSTAWGLPRSTLADDRARAEARLVTHLAATGKVTVRSRSGTAPDLAPSDPDSEGAQTFRPASASSDPTAAAPRPSGHAGDHASGHSERVANERDSRDGDGGDSSETADRGAA